MLAAGGHKGNLGLGDGDSLLLHSTFYISTFPKVKCQRSRHMHAREAKGNILSQFMSDSNLRETVDLQSGPIN